MASEQSNRLQQYVARMVTMERQIEEALNQRLNDVRDHAEVSAFVRQAPSSHREGPPGCAGGTSRRHWRQ